MNIDTLIPDFKDMKSDLEVLDEVFTETETEGLEELE